MKTYRSAALLSLLLTGCSFSFSAGDSQPAHALREYTPISPKAKISAVSLGTSDQDEFDAKRVGRSLPDGATRAIVWLEWDGAKVGHVIDVRWYDAESETLLLTQTERVEKPFGQGAWMLKKQDGSALPTGSYKVELVENGTVVTTIPFTVGS